MPCARGTGVEHETRRVTTSVGYRTAFGERDPLRLNIFLPERVACRSSIGLGA